MEITDDYIKYKETLRREYTEHKFQNYLPANFKLNIKLNSKERTIVDVITLLTYQLRVIEIHAPVIFDKYGISSTPFDFWHDHIFLGENDDVYKYDEVQLIKYLVNYAEYECGKRRDANKFVLNDLKERRHKIRRSLDQIFLASNADIIQFYDLLRKYEFINDDNLYIFESCPSKISASIAGFLKAFYTGARIKSSYSEFQAAFTTKFHLLNNRITTLDSPSYTEMKEIIANQLKK